MYQKSQVQSLGPPRGAMTSNWSWWRNPNEPEPPAPIENPTMARCVTWRVRVTVPASGENAAW